MTGTSWRKSIAVFSIVAKLSKIALLSGFVLAILIGCAGSACAASQPTGLSAFHRSGQTFLTWNELGGISGEHYRVYRHTAPITSTNLGSARRLATLPEGTSCYWTERARANDYPSEFNGGYTSIQNYVIQPLGPQLPSTTGLFVWTAKESQASYYAVTSVDGVGENVTDFTSANTFGPVSESVAAPEPVMVWESSSGRGHVFTQFMDFENWNPTYESPLTEMFTSEAMTYAYNYFVGTPSTEQCGDPLPDTTAVLLHIEGYGSRYEAYDGSHYFCATEIWCDDPWQSWYFGYSQTHDYTNREVEVTTGPIVNFTEERLLRAVYDTLRISHFSGQLDSNRIYSYGHSMGASGSLALGMRYPNVFAAVYCSEPMTNYITSTAWNDDAAGKWGSIARNLPIQIRGVYASHLAKYNGTGVWDWHNQQSQLLLRKDEDMAHISLAHGTLDDVIAWSTQGQPVYGVLYQSRQPFSGATVNEEHTWIGFNGMGPTVGDAATGAPFFGFTVVRNETMPGLSYASGDSPIPPTGVGTYNTSLEWSASWNPWAGPPTDTSSRWEMALRSTSGNQTVDVTPRRLQNFNVTAGQSYNWERRTIEGTFLSNGVVVADASKLITVPAVSVSEAGILLRIEADQVTPEPTSTYTPTPTNTPTAFTPTITDTPLITATPTNTTQPTSTPTYTPTGGPNPTINAPIDVYFPQGVTGTAPVTVGVPLPAGTWNADDFTVVDTSGAVPSQIRASANSGPGGSVNWLLVDFQAEQGETYHLQLGDSPTPPTSIEITGSEETGLVIDTGAARFDMVPTSDILGQIRNQSGAALVQSASWNLSTVTATLELVEAGPLRAMVRLRASQAVQGLDLVARLHFFAGKPYMKAQLTLTNHTAASWGYEFPDPMPTPDNGDCGFEGGQPVIQGLNSPGTIVFDDITWSLDLTQNASTDEVLYQDSSGTGSWNYYLGHAPRMQAGVTRRGYTRSVGGIEVASGNVADGTMAAGGVRMDVPWFRELFPKALRIQDGNLQFGVFPGEFSIDHRLRTGEQKTHDVWVSLDTSNSPPWGVIAMPGFEQVRSTHALGYVGPRRQAYYFDYEDYLDAQFQPTREHRDGYATSVDNAQEINDMFGYLDFGDLPTDFEQGAPYNLKYDVGLGFVHQALRTGDANWRRWAEISSRHFADVDIFHSPVRDYTQDRGWHEGGAWGHSLHDETGFTNPHRNCNNPNMDLTYGMTGMAAWSLLTGDEVTRDAAVEMANNTLWRLRNSADTLCESQIWGGGNGMGYAIGGPNERAAGNTIRLLVWAWRLTGDQAYLDAAAGAGAWYLCEEANLTCASWPTALFGRALGEYILAAREAGLTVSANSTTAMQHLLQTMSNDMTIQGDRAWFTGCTGNEINAWMLLAADVFALGYAVTGDRQWLDDYAVPSFNTGSRDPFYEGDIPEYHSSKELVNAVAGGTIFIYFASSDQPVDTPTPTSTSLASTATPTPTDTPIIPTATPSPTPPTLHMDGNGDGVVDALDLLHLMQEWHK